MKPENVERSKGSQKSTGNKVESETVEMNKGRSQNITSDEEGGVISKGLLGVLGAVAGGALLFRGAKGHWPFAGTSQKKASGKITVVDLNSKVIINRPREELYAYWRNLENLPNFMSHLKEVKELDDTRSQWTAKIPGGLGTVEWDAEIVRERTNHLLAWRSLPNSEIENAGEVRFENAPGGRTIVETTISYRPPAGEIGDYAAKLFNPAFQKIVKKDLEQFKKVMEKRGKKSKIEPLTGA